MGVECQPGTGWATKKGYWEWWGQFSPLNTPEINIYRKKPHIILALTVVEKELKYLY